MEPLVDNEVPDERFSTKLDDSVSIKVPDHPRGILGTRQAKQNHILQIQHFTLYTRPSTPNTRIAPQRGAAPKKNKMTYTKFMACLIYCCAWVKYRKKSKTQIRGRQNLPRSIGDRSMVCWSDAEAAVLLSHGNPPDDTNTNKGKERERWQSGLIRTMACLACVVDDGALVS